MLYSLCRDRGTKKGHRTGNEPITWVKKILSLHVTATKLIFVSL